MVELSQPSATDATLDLATGTGTCAFAVADAVEEAKRWGPNAGAGALGGAPEGSVASVLGLDKDRHALKRANEALLNLRSPKENESFTSRVRVAFAWADACHADAPWHEEKKRSFARAYCAFGLNHFADPETACRRVRESLVPGGTFVASVWAPLEKKTQPLFYAAYLAVVETIDLMETKRATNETWLVAAKTAAFAHFAAPFTWVEPSIDPNEDTNARAIDKLERVDTSRVRRPRRRHRTRQSHAVSKPRARRERVFKRNAVFQRDVRFAKRGFPRRVLRAVRSALARRRRR